MHEHPIHTNDDYRTALREASALFDDPPELGTEQGDFFEVLTTLVEAYEARTFPIDLERRGSATASKIAVDSQ